MRTTAQLHMIFWTLAAVVLVGIGVVASVLQPPEAVLQARARHHLETKIEVAAVATTETGSDHDDKVGDGRSPASAEPQFSSLDIDGKGTQAIDFNLPCEGNGRFSRNVVQVRLTGSLCQKNARKSKPARGLSSAANDEIVSSEIRNVTNGFSATVFYTGTKSDAFTTDYITLASGENHIRIQHILKSGARLDREFVIQRTN